MNIQIEEKHAKIIKDILSKYPYSFFAFGSRAKYTSDKFSDLDLCFFDQMPNNIKLNIEEEFEESDLPYKVDIIDYNNCPTYFQE